MLLMLKGAVQNELHLLIHKPDGQWVINMNR